MDDVRKEFENRIRWSDYVKAKATDASLRKFVADNQDLFSNTQVRASHILLKVEPDASAADKEKIKQKLLGIKADIDQNKITFAAAANKYSEDPANEGGAGGDLDYFSLNTGLIEEFTDVAFKLKKGAISGVVETPFGFHLIQVTDRKEGKPDRLRAKQAANRSSLCGRSSEKRRHRRAENRQDRRQTNAQGSLPARNIRLRASRAVGEREDRLPGRQPRNHKGSIRDPLQFRRCPVALDRAGAEAAGKSRRSPREERYGGSVRAGRRGASRQGRVRSVVAGFRE